MENQGHIRRRHNTIKQLLLNGVITTDFVKSKDNIADPLTKGLSREQVVVTMRGMGLKPINRLGRKPNLVDRRSQDLGSIGQLARVDHARKTHYSHSYICK